MKTLYLFTGYKKNSELCLPYSTASKRRCKHRLCGSFFALFLIFVLFLVSSCGGGPPPIGNSTKVDDNGNGLIDIYTPTQLHNMRYDLEGTSYKTDNSDVTGDTSGCPGGVCRGYELRQDLTFDTEESKDGTWSTSDNGYTLDPDDNAPPYFVVSEGGWQPIGTQSKPFNSIFEGNGNTITGLATRRDATSIGMFGATGASADIRRVGLVANLADYTGTSRAYIGGLVGYSSGSITASYATGAANGSGNIDNIGGLVGYQDGSGSITASYATGTANGGADSDRIGGLVGWQQKGNIIASYATGTADGGVGFDRVGGLVGLQENGSITASYATGTANGGGGDFDRVGGLVGQSSGNIIASYATGAADGGDGNNDKVGGLVGVQFGSTTDSYGFGTATRGTTNDEGKPPTGVTANTLILATAGDSWNNPAWDFGKTSEAPALQYADYDGPGTGVACGDAASTNNTISIPYCGGATEYFLPGQGRTPFLPTTDTNPNGGAVGSSALLGSFALVDQDHDGYIDINNLGALRNIIHNPEGTSYKTSAASQGRTTGCPSNICRGYELTRNFSAAEVVSGGGLDHLLRNILTQDAVIKSNGYSIADLYLED